MRVCLASLHPRILSGQIDSLAGLGRALSRRGHDIQLVTPTAASSELLEGRLTDLDAGPLSLSRAAGAMAAAVPRILKASSDADVLHLALPTPAFGWLADIVTAASHVPVAVSFESHLASGAQLIEALHRPRSLKSRLPLWLINNGLFGRMSAHLCRRYVVSSQYQRQELVALGVPDENITVVTNIVEDTKLRVVDPRIARRQLGLPQGQPTIGYIGHFNDVKGADTLAEAFASLAHSRPDTHLALAWSGQGNPAPVRRRLEGLERHVTWLGKVEVGSFFSAIDVLALPYRSTAGQGVFPSLLIEALHMGRPLVTSDLPLLQEIASGEDVAMLCPPDRPAALAVQLDRLLSSADMREAMSRRQLAAARQRFAPDRVVPKYEALYQCLVGEQVREQGRQAA